MSTLEVLEAPVVKQTPEQVELRDVGRGDPIYLADPSVGEGLDQGDTILQYLGDKLGRDCIQQYDILADTDRVVDEDIQVTDGTGIGSRHVVKAHPKLRTVENVNKFPLVGRFFYVEEGGELRQDHPEHATIRFDTPGWYVSRFQRAPNLSGSSEHGESRTATELKQDRSVLSTAEYFRRYE